MNSLSGKLRFVIALFFIAGASGCSDTALVDVNKEISNRNWSYIKKISVPVKIEDTNKRYNLYMNLRHTADYRYSNIFVLIRQVNPDGKKTTERKEFKLAYPDGEWLGSGSGNLYTYQLLFKEGYTFPAPGNYVFEIEQNMRDNPLREVRDVGMRIEPEE
jgi:gliding motility-associated lipoprotein GldH